VWLNTKQNKKKIITRKKEQKHEVKVHSNSLADILFLHEKAISLFLVEICMGKSGAVNSS